jgi:hypothetical protein
MRRSSDAYRRALDRRRRQDEAERLREAAPDLESLELDVREHRVGMPGHEVHYKRFIVVDRAPALFDFPCSDRACEGGGHELTHIVLRHIRRREEHFSGKHVCQGHARDGACKYELSFEANARYRKPREAPREASHHA